MGMKYLIGRRGQQKKNILKRLFGIHKESFQNLYRTLLAIRDSNSGTIIT